MNARPAPTQIGYGGDYNPEQWPRPVWDEDYAAFDLAGIDTLTVGVFAWAHLQPAEDRDDFSTLDAIVQRATAGGKRIVLATPSGAMPPWLAKKYPEACRGLFPGLFGTSTANGTTTARPMPISGGCRVRISPTNSPSGTATTRQSSCCTSATEHAELPAPHLRCRLPGLAAQTVRRPGCAEPCLEHHVLVAHLHRLG